LDQQVVRSALKSYRNLFSSDLPSLSSLSPSSNYLRLLLTPPALNVSLSIQDFADPNTSILLLELRAALIVQDHAKNLETGEIDASVNQRVSKAVTEAFIAVQVASMIKGLEDVGINGNDADVVKKIYLLVGHLSLLCHSLCFVLDSDCHCGDVIFHSIS
jgi:acyl-CoA oxidase